MTRLQQEVARKLHSLGCESEFKNETGILNITLEGQPICRIHPDDSYTYLPNDHTTDEQVDAFHAVEKMIDTAKEYISDYENAPQFEIDGIKDYRKLAEFGGVVFGAKDMGEQHMLMEYPYGVTVKIDGIAASAASVIAMAGTKVLMSPTAMMMCHNPLTIAIGDTEEMQKAIAMLGEVKESIITAYEIKTGLSRAKISHLMDCETWMNAKKAIEYGFADGLLEDDKRRSDDETDVSFAFSRRAVTNSILGKCMKNAPAIQKKKIISTIADSGVADSDIPDTLPEKPGVSAESLEKRLSLLTH